MRLNLKGAYAYERRVASVFSRKPMMHCSFGHPTADTAYSEEIDDRCFGERLPRLTYEEGATRPNFEVQE